jgi:hypothetical protein
VDDGIGPKANVVQNETSQLPLWRLSAKHVDAKQSQPSKNNARERFH